MNDENRTAVPSPQEKPEPTQPGPSPAKTPPQEEDINQVIIRPLPDIVYLYPSCIAGFACAIWQSIVGMDSPWPGLIFMVILWVNYIILAFDFSRVSTLAVILGGTALIVGGMYIGEKYNIQILRFLVDLVRSINMQANVSFYLGYSFFLLFIYVLVFIKTRFDYWVVTHNELLHYRGILGDVERYPAPNLRVTKEIDDVFEFLLLQSGKLIITPASELRSIELDNVPRVNRVEKALNKLLSQIRVEMAR